MHETPDDLTTLQRVLDQSYENAGNHLLSIFMPQRRVSAADLVAVLRGVCILDLATVTSQGAPIVAPVYGPEWDSWGYWPSMPYAVIEPHRMYAAAMRPEVLEP